jgi:cytidine deaminase
MKRHEIIDRERLSLEWRVLIASAMEARGRAYAPYSGFPVGAAVSTASGRVFSGCNVENASSGLTVCAERVAIWKAVTNGEREFSTLAVVTEPGATPCGACRQVLSEFAEDVPILVATTQGRIWVASLSELLPYPFPRIDLADVLRPEAPQ